MSIKATVNSRLNKEIANETEMFHRGTMLWTYGGCDKYDEYYDDADGLTRDDLKDIQRGWNWLENSWKEANTGESYV